MDNFNYLHFTVELYVKVKVKLKFSMKVKKEINDPIVNGFGIIIAIF